jgi:hypothetical protein
MLQMLASKEETAMKVLVIALVALSALVLASPSYAQAKFTTEQQAQQHCPSDVVVSVNLPSGIYHMKGERW